MTETIAHYLLSGTPYREEAVRAGGELLTRLREAQPAGRG
jgi:hypothetical protein